MDGEERYKTELAESGISQEQDRVIQRMRRENIRIEKER